MSSKNEIKIENKYNSMSKEEKENNNKLDKCIYCKKKSDNKNEMYFCDYCSENCCMYCIADEIFITGTLKSGKTAKTGGFKNICPNCRVNNNKLKQDIQRENDIEIDDS
jgi:hypothetical protein